MKKFYVILFAVVISFTVEAKKVKFSVDMDTIAINSTGVHVFGDFQAIAGFPGGDWQSNTTPLAQEGATNIYSIIVDIPAFAKYEYKFLNGDQSYEIEFVPDPSRVGYGFDDNRWLYVDSLADDTTDVGAILFSGNAPAGLTLMRFLVDMQGITIPPAGAHVAGDFQGWDPTQNRLYSFGGTVYEVIAYAAAGTYEYKFYNGNTASDAETVPGGCAVSGNRLVPATTDTVLTTVCFSSCVACPTGIAEFNSHTLNVYPNPASDYFVLQTPENQVIHSLEIHDLSGRRIRIVENDSNDLMRVSCGDLSPGIYFVTAKGDRGFAWSEKIIVR